jgi:acyl carrier protein
MTSRPLTAVTAALRRVLDDDGTPIEPGTRILDELGLDSTTVLQLLVEIEDALDVEFDADSLGPEDFATVQALSDYAEGQLAAS